MYKRRKTNSFQDLSRTTKHLESLNKPFRKQELQRINSANKGIYKRLKSVQSDYESKKLLKERKKVKKVIHRMCRYKKLQLGSPCSNRTGSASAGPSSR